MRRVSAALALTLAACFSVHEPSDGGADIDCARARQAPGPDTLFVRIEGFAFHPAALDVAEGTTVIWVNCEAEGTVPHTTSGDAWDSPSLGPGDHFAVEPPVGTHDYACRPHPFMQGRVTVSAAQLRRSRR